MKNQISNSTTKVSPVWHPFTQMKGAPESSLVLSGSGAWLTLSDGRKILDLISSWWVTLHGHANPVIAEAIANQAQTLEQVIFAGFTHEPAETLATRLLGKLPSNLRHVFFSDNGSTAVEVALKMAFQYWLNRGFEGKNKFIGFNNGYHGDTVGAMSVGSGSKFWNKFQPLLFEIDCVDYPNITEHSCDILEKEFKTLQAIDKLTTTTNHNYAGIIIEPLVQGAGGFNMCRPEFLKALQTLANSRALLLIYDEVMTGFGRTGDWFACTKSKTSPDVICLSKGLSGGFLPLAATVATNDIYQAFFSDDPEQAFLHGHSFTGNPISCAAANASLSLLEQGENLFKSMESIHRQMSDHWLKDNPKILNRRFYGTITAMDVASTSNIGYFDPIGKRLRKQFFDRGLLIRPLGNTVYLMPPYCISSPELELAYKVIAEEVSKLD